MSRFALAESDIEFLPDVISLGGKGSGNFGHTGRKGEIGGSSDTFHGTTVQSAAKIKTQGLRVGSNKDETEVFVAEDLNTALSYGLRKAPKSGDFAVVVVKGSTPGLTHVDGFATSKVTITPEYIREVRVYNTKQFKDYIDPETQEINLGGDAAPKPLRTLDSSKYLVVFFPDEPTVLGGKGSGNYGHHGRPGEKGGSGEGDSEAKVRNERSLRALKAFIPIHAESQRYAEANELAVRKMIGGKRTEDNLPVDVITTIDGRTKGVEVKTMINNTNDKITMRKAAVEKKEAWGRANHASVHTVVLDDRGLRNNPGYSGHRIYYSKGSGSFRLGGMTKVRDAQHLRDLLGGKRLRTAGGPGSGNFGHGGRPGQVGGSSSDEGQESKPSPVSNEQIAKIHELKAQGLGNASIAKRMGWHYSEGNRVQRVLDTFHPNGDRKDGVPAPTPVPAPKPDVAPPAPKPAEFSVEWVQADIASMRAELKNDRVQVKMPYSVNPDTTIGRHNLYTVQTGLRSMIDARAKMREAGVNPPAVRMRFAPIEQNAYASALRQRITINTKNAAWQDPDRLAASLHQDYRSYYHPVDTVHSVMVHEMGHVMHQKNAGADYVRWHYDGQNSDKPVSVPSSAREVSRYAATHRLEFVAETFAAMVDGKKYSEHVMKDYEALKGPKVPGRK